MRKIDAAELMSRLSSGSETLVVDVVAEDKFNAEHIPGAISIPLSRPEFPNWVKELARDTNKPVAVYCEGSSSDLSQRAARELEDAGFSDVANLEGGIEAWKAAGFPTARA